MFRFKIESTAKRRSLLALATSVISQLSPAHGLQHGICSPQQLVLHPVSNLTKGWEQRFATLQNVKARWFLSNSININISQRMLQRSRSKISHPKISEMNEMTWTNIYTIHPCKHGQTPFIPPGCRVNLQSGSVGCHQTQVSHHGAGTANAQGGASRGPKRCLLGELRMLVHVRYEGICSIHDSGKSKSWLRALYIYIFFFISCTVLMSFPLFSSCLFVLLVQSMQYHEISCWVMSVAWCLQTYRNWSCLVPIWGWYSIIAGRLKVGDFW